MSSNFPTFVPIHINQKPPLYLKSFCLHFLVHSRAWNLQWVSLKTTVAVSSKFSSLFLLKIFTLQPPPWGPQAGTGDVAILISPHHGDPEKRLMWPL